MRTLERAAFTKILQSYYALSFQLSQGYPPLECIYNALFCQWLQQEFFFPQLSGEDIAQMLPMLVPPAHHKQVRSVSITRINTYASASFVSTWNALFCPDADSPYLQVCQRQEQISNELRSFDPADALHLLEEGERDALLETGIQHMAGMDCKFLLYGRPGAHVERTYESFVREYILAQRETHHEFFRELMRCWCQKWLQHDIHNQKAIRYLGMAAAIWQQHHPGETFYPPQWPEEVSYLSQG
jgi:hypothetical protein